MLEFHNIFSIQSVVDLDLFLSTLILNLNELFAKESSLSRDKRMLRNINIFRTLSMLNTSLGNRHSSLHPQLAP